MKLRIADQADAGALAQVHVAAWLETYPGLVPDSYLARLSVAERAQRWEQVLSAPFTSKSTRVFLAHDAAGSLAGFGSCGPQRWEELSTAGFAGEFQAIYVLRRAQRLGIGRRLMEMMALDLLERGIDGASVWVLRDNLTARRFYESLGGVVVLTSDDWKEGEIVLHEVAYGWSHLGRAFGAASTSGR